MTTGKKEGKILCAKKKKSTPRESNRRKVEERIP